MFLYEDEDSSNIICTIISISLYHKTPKMFFKDKQINLKQYLWLNPNISFHENEEYDYVLSKNTLCIGKEIFKDYNDINEDEVDYKIKILIHRMKNKKWTIHIPIQPHPNGFYRHKGDSFRELCKLIENANDYLIIENTNSGHVWLEPNILLYDRPKLEHINKEALNASMILLGNGSMNVEGKELKKYIENVKQFIFWGRYPEHIELRYNDKYLEYDERTINSIFVGNIENPTQENFRKDKTWNDVLDIYHMTYSQKHIFTKDEYITMLQKSKYGLCLRGYGSKCNREIELLSTGCVPLITPECSTDYGFPFIENEHFLRIEHPEDVQRIVAETSKKKWAYISKNCRNLFMKYCHSNNAFKSILSNIFDINY